MSNPKRNPGPRRKSMQRVGKAPQELPELPEADVPRRRPADTVKPTVGLNDAHRMILAPLNRQITEEYIMLHRSRGTVDVQPPQSGACVLWISKQGQWLLAAGLATMVTSGPYVLLDGLVTNPAVPMKARHRAVIACVREAIGFCQQIGKRPMAFIRSPGMARIAVKLGAQIVVGAMAIGPTGKPL